MDLHLVSFSDTIYQMKITPLCCLSVGFWFCIVWSELWKPFGVHPFCTKSAKHMVVSQWMKWVVWSYIVFNSVFLQYFFHFEILLRVCYWFGILNCFGYGFIAIRSI